MAKRKKKSLKAKRRGKTCKKGFKKGTAICRKVRRGRRKSK